MKTHFKTLVLITVTLAALTASAQYERFYVKADVGGMVTPDANVEELFGPVGPGREVHFDTGARVGFVGGFRVTDWFSVEVETGLMASHIDSIDGSVSSDATFANAPFLGNIRFQCPMPCWVTPYIGAGAGMSAAIFDGEVVVPPITPGGPNIRVSGSQNDTVFAWQAFAGVRFAINERMSLSVEYHYFVTDEPEWKADSFGLTSSDRMRFGAIQTHAASLAFEYRF